MPIRRERKDIRRQLQKTSNLRQSASISIDVNRFDFAVNFRLSKSIDNAISTSSSDSSSTG